MRSGKGGVRVFKPVFPLLGRQGLRGREGERQSPTAVTQEFIGHSYKALTDCYRAIMSSRQKRARSLLLIEEVDSELKNFRATGRFIPDAPEHTW